MCCLPWHFAEGRKRQKSNLKINAVCRICLSNLCKRDEKTWKVNIEIPQRHYKLPCFLLIFTSNWLTVLNLGLYNSSRFPLSQASCFLNELCSGAAKRKWCGKLHILLFYLLWLQSVPYWPYVKYHSQLFVFSNYIPYTVFFSFAWWICTHLMFLVQCCPPDSEFAL